MQGVNERYLPSDFRVRAAFLAEALRLAALRRLAAPRACRESERWDAALRGSRFSAFSAARDRFADGFLFADGFPFAVLFLRDDDLPRGGSFTPARRASDNPMAMACFVDRAPCFPLRMCSISWRTNSPACVEGALPSAASFRARSMVFFSGMRCLLEEGS
jgi:hypothetical protein